VSLIFYTVMEYGSLTEVVEGSMPPLASRATGLKTLDSSSTTLYRSCLP
jgi:hypothetical protein